MTVGKIFAQKSEKFQNKLPKIIQKQDCLVSNRMGWQLWENLFQHQNEENQKILEKFLDA
jgi:hypothetical protein